MAPRVSVIMAAHNAASTITNSIDSIIAQTVVDWEMIIVDDGSSDDTAMIANSYASDARITVISTGGSRGSGFARNLAAERARGKYLAIQDADDVSEPVRFERQLALAESSDDIVAVGARIREFGAWGGPVDSLWPVEPSKIEARQRANNMPIAHCVALIRRDVFLEVGGYLVECRRAQDYGLFLKLRHRRVVAVDEPLVRYRTARPLRLAYALGNGRYSALARAIVLDDRPWEEFNDLPRRRRLWTDFRSTVSWARRRLRERGGAASVRLRPSATNSV